MNQQIQINTHRTKSCNVCPSEGHNSDEGSETTDDNPALGPPSLCAVAAPLHSDSGRDSTESLDEMQRNAKDGDGKELLTTDVVAVGQQ